MAKRGGRKRGQRRVNNIHVIGGGKRNRKWTPLVQAVVPKEAADEGVTACAQNQLYTVFIKETTSPGFEALDEQGNPVPMKIVHLIIIRNDRKSKEIDWGHKQRIKNELCGPMCEAVELFPAQWRVQEMTQCHLWVLAPGASFPLGVFPENFAGTATPAEVTVTKEELEVFVVRGDIDGTPFIEVFADEEEAKAAYDKAGNILTGGGIERIGDVPTIDDGAAWTDAAKAKVANVIAKAEALDRMNVPEHHADVELPFYDDGPRSVEEEIDPELDFDMSLCEKEMPKVYGPVALEENIQIAEFMEEKLSAIKAEREIRIEEAAQLVGEKIAEQDQVSEEEAASEAEAKDELAKMREEMLGKKPDPRKLN